MVRDEHVVIGKHLKQQSRGRTCPKNSIAKGSLGSKVVAKLLGRLAYILGVMLRSLPIESVGGMVVLRCT
jgi:hypothetical protein